MKFLSLIVVLSLALSSTAFSCTEDGSSGIIEDNSLRIPVGSKFAGGISEAEFGKVIDDLEAIYVPVIKKMGGKLVINRLWTNETANASASRSLGNTWTVNMYGGLARHPAITKDGFSLVLCHEIGHHIGGAPKNSGILGLMKWASNEGQSDYWATSKCLRTLFWNDNNQQIVKKMNAPEALVSACEKANSNKDEAAICVRGGMAGASVAGFFAAARNQAASKFETPDTSKVAKTNNSHPATQCRLDTYFQGALCEKSHTEDVSQKDEVQGTCHGFTGHKSGLRPLCWFKPTK